MTRRLAVLLIACGCASRPLAQVEGVWESSGGFEYAEIDVAADGTIRWRSGGCLDDASGKSRGRFRDGKLALLPPMEFYAGEEASLLLYRKEGDREYLLTERQTGLAAEDDDEPFGRGFWWGLRRRLPKALLESRIAESRDGAERSALLYEWTQWGVDLGGAPLLARLAREDPSDDVRRTAIVALEYAGKDEYGTVTDPAVAAAAEAALAAIPGAAGE